MSYNLDGVSEFEDFASDIRSLRAKIPQVIENAVELTAYDYRDYAIDNIRGMSTSNGGTFDSRTSPYSPGGTNDSSDDNLHIAEKDAWIVYASGKGAFVTPKPEVQDRAWWIENGTSDHGPSGDTPMYYYVGSDIVVVIDGFNQDKVSEDFEPGAAPTRILNEQDVLQSGDGPTVEEQFDYGNLGEVSGVRRTLFFQQAARRVRSNKRFEKHLKDQLSQAIDSELGGA